MDKFPTPVPEPESKDDADQSRAARVFGWVLIVCLSVLSVAVTVWVVDQLWISR